MISSIASGLASARRGLAQAWASAEVRRTYAQLVAALFVLSSVLDVVGIWAVWAWTRAAGDASWWSVVVLVLLRIAGIAIVLLVAPIVALFVVDVVFPFLGDRVFIAGMRQLHRARAAELEAMPGRPLARVVIDALVRLVAFLAIGLALLLLSLVPVVGSIAAPVLQTWRSAVVLGWELLDPYFDKLGLDRAAQRELLRRHQAAVLGFSLPFVFVMAIPFVGALMFGLAQAAVAALVVDVIECDTPVS